MTRKPDDWSDLSQVWTEPAPGADEAADRDRALMRAVIRRDRLGRLNFYTEAATCAVAALLGARLLLFGEHREIGAAALLFGLLSLALTLWARSSARTLSLETPEQALRTALAQAEAGLRWSLAGGVIGLAAVGFVATVLLTAQPGSDVARTTVGLVSLFMLAGMGLYLRHGLRCLKRIARHRAALDDLARD